MYAVISSRRLIRVPTNGVILVARRFLAGKSSPNVGGGNATFTISYLTNSCGLSLKDAIPVSEKLCITSRENSDKVLERFNEYGFTKAQISKLVAKWPRVLQSCADKTILPKLAFFKSIGVPPADLPRRVSEYPCLLRRGVESYFIPWYDYLKSILGSDKKVVTVFLSSPMAFTHGWPRRVPSNIAILRKRGVPESFISSLLVKKPSLFLLSNESFSAYVDRAAAMGFHEKKMAFVQALQVFGKMSEPTLKRKMDVYRKCGWSETDMSSAFLRYPLCLKHSQKKIRANMDFLVDELGLKPSDVARNPMILDFSAEKRMRPRWIVARILKAKGLMRVSQSFSSLFVMSEADFLKKHVVDHEGEIPQLLDIYRGKIGCHEIGLDGNLISR